MQQINEVKIPCDRCDKSIPFREFTDHKLQHDIEDNAKLIEVKNADLQAQLAEAQKKIDDLTQQQAKTAEEHKQKLQETEKKVKDLQDEAKKNNVQYPKWWDMNALATLKYGEEKMIDLDINSNETAKEVLASFNVTASNHQVTKIEGVMNQMLYDKWWNEKQLMIKNIGKDKLNIRNLFHGTRNGDVMKFIVREGFRAEFNTAYAVGMGTYFAKAASTSVGYSANVNGQRKMFRCAVICGEGIAGSSNYTLKAWPKKPNGLIYDSLVSGAVTDPSVVVIHENARIYPMFIIHFT